MSPPRRGPVARLLLAVIGFYARAVSPALPPRCRFAPTCSAYAAEAVAVHGAGRGSWLALRRLLKCAPWHPGGYDPVPPRRGGGTPAPDAASGRAVPAPAPVAEPERSRRDPTSPPAHGRSAQQEARVA
ncbi:membrane protein insertion efficiency factor YidD [Trujillonella humicola]|uniref:membrane protein insertion efficiency factor YidD n=1 Tax=Trujillonella humicola TaxID=3383699 RepID=UPI003906AF1D